MNAETYRRIQEIFDEAVNLPPQSQAPLVEALAEDNQKISSVVMAMLREDAGPQPLLDTAAETYLAGLADATLQSDHIRSLIQRQIGPYRLVRVLGEGGMGIVYLAERTDIGGLVAVKLLRDAWLSPMRRERFALEQQILVKLNHPAIARIYDANTMEDGTPWFVMEFADGLPFADYLIARDGSLRDDLILFRRVCEAIAYAHSHAIIHRDIKPSNIIVTAQGEIKLLDFGIAKQMEGKEAATPRTTIGLQLMTPGYAAPEQFAGGSVGVFTDVYSLGVLLYETLTGQVPPLQQQSGKAPEKPSSLVLSGRSASKRLRITKREWADLDVVCQKALQTEPQLRYGSVDALMRDITAMLEGRVLEARPPSIAYATHKFARRNRLALITAGAATCLLVGSISVFTVHLAQARNAAVAEAARTRRIQEFMGNMLGAADVEAGPSNDLKVVTLLDQELQQASLLSADKVTQADLYQTIGTMYCRLGKFEKAEQVLRQALDRTKQVEGSAGRRQAAIQLELAIVEGDHGEIPEAQRSLQQSALTAAAAHLGRNDPFWVETQVANGKIALLNGDYKTAEDVLTPISRLNPKAISNYDLRDAVAALAEAEMYTHHYELAEASSHRAIDMDKQLLGASHPQTSYDLMNLGATKASLGEFAEAEQLYRQGIENVERWYGKDHPDVITASSILARVLISQGKTAGAEAILLQTLNLQKAIYGPVHERVEFPTSALGELAMMTGRPKIAEMYFEQSVHICQSIYGSSHLKTAGAKSNLGAAYLLEGRNSLAETVLRQAVETYEALPYDTNYTGLTRGRLGHALFELKRYKEASVQLTLADGLLKKMAHPPSHEVKNVKADLAALQRVTHQPGVLPIHIVQPQMTASMAAK